MDRVDRINALPEPLLFHILSFLCTKEAARTSVLSRRWRYLFASIPDIDLEIDNYCGTEFELEIEHIVNQRLIKFLNFGYRLILLRNGAPIRKFRLCLGWVRRESWLAIDSFITAALLCKIHQLDIWIATAEYANRFFTLGIFMCKSLTDLKLWCSELEDLYYPNSVSLPILRRLHFQFAGLVDDSFIRRIIEGCPLLEELRLSIASTGNEDRGANAKVVDFSSPSVKHLMLDLFADGCNLLVVSNNLESLHYQVHRPFHRSEGDRKVTINAPNLNRLAFDSPTFGVECIQDFKSLVEAKLALGPFSDLRRSQDAIQLLNRVHNVNSLCLRVHFLKALYHLRHLVPTFKNLTTLELESAADDHDVDHILSWKTLPSLLENAPKLEVLVYDEVIWSSASEDNEFECLFLEVLPICFVECLKTIEVKSFGSREYEFKLIEYLLQNAKALKKITIRKYLNPAVCKRILSFKRCSEECRIILDKSKTCHSPISGDF